MATMTCTACFKNTDIEAPDTDKWPVDVVVAFCKNWRCAQCLDEAADKFAQINDLSQ